MNISSRLPWLHRAQTDTPASTSGTSATEPAHSHDAAPALGRPPSRNSSLGGNTLDQRPRTALSQLTRTASVASNRSDASFHSAVSDQTLLADEDAIGKETGFHIPERKHYIGEMMPREKRGYALIRSNDFRVMGPAANVTGIAIGGVAGPTIGAVANQGFVMMHESVSAVTNLHAWYTSHNKRARYQEQLKSMLAQDLADVHLDRASLGPQGAAHRPQELMIFKRDKKGEFEYDLTKVRQLAENDAPHLGSASLRAKNILLTAYISESATKQSNRAVYEGIRNTIALGGAAALIIGTHGGAIGAAAAGVAGAKGVGVAMGTLSSLDVAAAHRGVKQQLRDEKQRLIDSGIAQRNRQFAVDHSPAQPAGADRLHELEAMPKPALQSLQKVFREQAVAEAAQQNFRLVPGKLINHNKSTPEKDAYRSTVSAHAAAVFSACIGIENPALVPKYRTVLDELYASGPDQFTREKALKSAINADPNLKNGYRFLRDVGFRRSEARQTIHAALEQMCAPDVENLPDAVATALGGPPQKSLADKVKGGIDGALKRR